MRQVHARGNGIILGAKPVKTARHFRSAGMRARLRRGDVKIEAATCEVPVWRGISHSVAKMVRNDVRRRKAKGKARREAEVIGDAVARGALS